MTSCCV